MASGILSKGIKFEVAPYNDGTIGTYTEITDCQEIPSLGGKPDKVEVTTLGDANKRYINGLIDYGDLSFKFLYDNSSVTSNYRVLKALTGINSFRITFPDTTTFVFDGECSCSIDSAAANAPLTFTADIALNSEITVTNPS